MTTSPQKYTRLSRILHWTMAVLIAVQFFTIFYVFVRGENDPAVLTMVKTHHASGMIVFVLLLIRLANRLLTQQPQLPNEHFTPLQVRLAKIGHLVLYALILGMPITGYAIMDASPYNAFFLSVQMPDVIDANEATMSRAMLLHWIGAWAIGLVILGHVALAILHNRKLPGFLRRML